MEEVLSQSSRAIVGWLSREGLEAESLGRSTGPWHIYMPMYPSIRTRAQSIRTYMYVYIYVYVAGEGLMVPI